MQTLRDKRFVQGHPGVPVSPCLFSEPVLLLPALLCIIETYMFQALCPVASRQVWLMRVYDRKLGEREGEAAVSSPLCLQRHLQLWLLVLWASGPCQIKALAPGIL